MHENADRSRRYLTYTDTYPASAITNPSPYNYGDRRQGYHPQQDVAYCSTVGCYLLALAIFFFGIGLWSAISNGNLFHPNVLRAFGVGVPFICCGVCFTACAVHTQNKIRRGQASTNTNGTYYMADSRRTWHAHQYTVRVPNSADQVQRKQTGDSESINRQVAGGTPSTLARDVNAEQENIRNAVLESATSSTRVATPSPPPPPPSYDLVTCSTSNNLSCFLTSNAAASTRTLTFAVPVLPPPPEYSRVSSAKRSSSLP